MIAELGRGGMGVVYKARHVQLNRLVALKMILTGGHAGDEALSRFRAEAQAVAQLQHPNIIQIFEIGEQDGLPYFSLELCSCGSLADRLDGTPLPQEQAVELIAILALAIHTAHQQGIVHRDLKPANVLLQSAGSGTWSLSEKSHPHTFALSTGEETTANFTPKITDFGLAKKLNETGQTHSGAVMGTPSYMAPEQAGDRTKEVGPATDIYALGAILYELLTGRPPFKGSTPVETVMQVVNQDPVPPIRLQPRTFRDVQTICLKCLRKDPAKRYGSALELAEDLRRFQAGEPILARPVGIIERTWRWCRRHPAIASSLTATALALLIGLAGILWFAFQAHLSAELALSEKRVADSARQVAIREKRHADIERKKAERLLYSSRIALAHRAWLDHNLMEAERLLALCPEGLWHWEHAFLSRLCQATHRTFYEHTDRVWSTCFSPNGKWLVTSGQDKTIKVYDRFSGKLLHNLEGHTGVVWSVSFCADGKHLASGSADKTVRVWDISTGKQVHLCKGHEKEVWYVMYSRDGKQLASTGQDKTIRLWDVESGKLKQTLEGHQQEVWSVAFSPNGSRLASAAGRFERDRLFQIPGELKLWDLETGKEIYTRQKHQRIVTSVDYSPDGQYLVTASYDRNIILWRAETGEEVRRFQGHTHWVGTVKFSPDGQFIASGSCDKTVKLWDIKTGRALETYHGHTDWVPCIAFSPNGRYLASASRDYTVQLWKLNPQQSRWTIHSHSNGILQVAIHPQGHQMASVGEDGKVLIHAIPDGRQLQELKGHNGAVHTVAYDPNGFYLATGGADKTIRLWSNKGHEVFQGKHKESVLRAMFDPRGEKLAVATGSTERFGSAGQVVVWDVATHKKLFVLSGHSSRVTDVVFSADGQRLFSSSGLWKGELRRHVNGEIRVWSMKDGAELKAIDACNGIIHAIRIGPNGKWLALGSEDQSIQLLDLEKEESLKSFRGHTGDVYSLALTLDGKRLFSSSADQTIRAWDVESGQELLAIGEHRGPVRSVTLHSNGHWLVSGGEDRLLKLWDGKAPEK